LSTPSQLAPGRREHKKIDNEESHQQTFALSIASLMNQTNEGSNRESNLNALGAIRALAKEKRNIPEDISIVSFDDPPYAAYLATPMTSIAQSYSEMGDVAVKLLFDQIQSGRSQPKGGILLPTSLVVRKSVNTYSRYSTEKCRNPPSS